MSTVIEQMKVVHQSDLSVEERITHRVAIYQNLLESAQTVVFTMNKLSIEPVDPRARV